MADRILQGWFFKLRRSHEESIVARHLTAAWSKRYFVVVKDKIKWYRSANPYSGEAPSGFVNFQQVLKIRVLNSESRLEDIFNRDEYGTYSIEIDSLERKLVIRTGSKEDAQTWVRELRRRMELWTERTGAETLKEITREIKPIDTRDHIMKRIDETLDKLLEVKIEAKSKSVAASDEAGKEESKRAESVADSENVEETALDKPVRKASKSRKEQVADVDETNKVKKKVAKKKPAIKSEAAQEQADIAPSSVKMKRKSSKDKQPATTDVKIVSKQVACAVDSEAVFSEEECKGSEETKQSSKKVVKKVSSKAKMREFSSKSIDDGQEEDDNDEDLRETLGLSVKTRTAPSSQKQASEKLSTKFTLRKSPRGSISPCNSPVRADSQVSEQKVVGNSIRADANWLEEDWD